MVVGILRMELFLSSGPNSLKEKRHIVKKLKDRILNKFDVSIAEVAEQDLWQKSVLGVAFVSGDKTMVESVLQKVISSVESEPAVEIVNVNTEIQHF
ncbi:MAG: DUF503 domain-containing protein [bacterium]